MGAQSRKKSWPGVSSSPLWAAVGSKGWPAGQFCLFAGLFLVEVVASRVTGSLLLLSCAFHTLGGTLVLGVSLTDARLAARGCPGRRNTFGWARARIAGTLVSTVFLSSLCLALLPEALRRVADPQVMEHVLALMGIGAMGIPIHLSRAGLHGQHPQDPGTTPCCSRRRGTQGGSCGQEMEDLLGNGSSNSGKPWTEEDREGSPMSPAEKSRPWSTLCLGWMVACLGPVAVLLYSLTFLLLWTPCLGEGACLNHCTSSPCWAWNSAEALQQRDRASCWLLYLDPGLAMAVAVALLCLAWPALHGSALVLLQAVPEDLDLQLLELQLQATEGVVAVQGLHVWQLDGPHSLVATAHVCCQEAATCEAVMDRVQQVFCEHGIHAATVQPDLGASPGGGCSAGCDRPASKRWLPPCPAEILECETTV
ncbi:proton-coupled zinc antiporter SLC30A1-like [Rhineura floridana]|uniref:proton-coupled zinc antiporter SLC30A1-like n=1 Tax=Rhineura floridana TaxID=261503 RepID=UPI002AC7F56C|nr:proton-coupled zinc antiporter SLC30A1-like [Rhineura floridana]